MTHWNKATNTGTRGTHTTQVNILGKFNWKSTRGNKYGVDQFMLQLIMDVNTLGVIYNSYIQNACMDLLLKPDFLARRKEFRFYRLRCQQQRDEPL